MRPLFIIIAFALLAVAGGGAYLARLALAGPPVPKSSVYHDAHERFRVTVPALWSSTQQSDGVTFTDSSGADTVSVTVAPADPGETASAAADALAGPQHLQAAPSAEIGGDTWEQRSGRVTGADGATRIVALYVDVRDGEIYAIQCSSPSASFTATNNLIYQPLLTSFAFGP